MKTKIRILSVILAVMCLVGFCGCSGGKNSKGDVRTITVWSGESHSKAVYDKLIKEYNEGQGKKDGIYIDYQVKEGSSSSQNIELALQTNDAPDFFTGDLTKLAQLGKIAALEDLPNNDEYVKKCEELGLLIDRYEEGGKHYAIPVSVTTRGLIYNKDMFKSAGIVDEKGEAKPPVTWAEMVECAKKLTNTAKKQYGYCLPLKWGVVSSEIVDPAMASIGSRGYNFATGIYEYEKMAPIFDAFLQMYKDGSCYPGAESLDNDQCRAYFSAGRIGMKIGFSFDVGVLNDQFPAECDWSVAPLPVIDENDKYLQPMLPGASFLMNAASVKEYPEEMRKVNEFFTSDEFLSAIYKGGVYIPYRADVIEKTTLDSSAKTGWKEFGDMVSISAIPPISANADTGNLKAIQDLFVQNVMTGKQTSLEMLTQYSKDYQACKDLYYKNHPGDEPTEHDIKDYDIHRK